MFWDLVYYGWFAFMGLAVCSVIGAAVWDSKEPKRRLRRAIREQAAREKAAAEAEAAAARLRPRRQPRHRSRPLKRRPKAHPWRRKSPWRWGRGRATLGRRTETVSGTNRFHYGPRLPEGCPVTPPRIELLGGDPARLGNHGLPRRRMVCPVFNWGLPLKNSVASAVSCRSARVLHYHTHLKESSPPGLPRRNAGCPRIGGCSRSANCASTSGKLGG